MTDDKQRSSVPPRLWTILAILAALAGALAAALKLLTVFQYWDDEGHMLLSLALYVKNGHLYTQTYSEYGPFFSYAQGIFFQLLHLPVTHDMGRLVTLIYWVASSLLAAVFVYRLSKSMFLGCAAGLGVMLVGTVLTNEPGHPQQLMLLLYMAAACLALPSLSGRYDLRLFLLGCVGAALAFTKVNVGVFFIAGLAHALVCLLPSGKIRSIGIGLTLIYAAACPWLLMHASFNHGFLSYCLLATVSGLAVFTCGALIRPSHALPLRAALCCGAGLLAGTVAIVAATSLQGMPVSVLVSGVILNPLHHPNVFYYLMDITRLNLWAALVLTAGLASLKLWGRRMAESQWLDALRCAAGTGSIFALTWHPLVLWVVPLLPLTLIPQAHWKRDAGALFTRLFITDMAVTQFLEPFPVAGSQVGVAAVPMILWAFLCIADGIAGLRAAAGRPSEESGEGWRLDTAIGGTILVVLAGASIAIFVRSPFPPAATGLKGSTWLHLPAEQAAQFESIVRNVAPNCSTLFTMPGMGSFNIWSGVPTPNGWNRGPWMKGIDSERQAEILNIMKSDSRNCAILNRDIVKFWDRDEADEARVAALPLARYVTAEMPKIAQFGEYEIRVHPNRNSPWLKSP